MTGHKGRKEHRGEPTTNGANGDRGPEGGPRAPIDSPRGTGYRMDMMEVPQVRVVRERPPETGGPAEYLRRAETLMAEADRLNPWPRPRGFVQRFRTREDYEARKKQQANPRLW